MTETPFPFRVVSAPVVALLQAAARGEVNSKTRLFSAMYGTGSHSHARMVEYPPDGHPAWRTRGEPIPFRLTEYGRAVMELALALDGAQLSRPGARALLRQDSARAFAALLRAGLVDEDDALTGKGRAVQDVLERYPWNLEGTR